MSPLGASFESAETIEYINFLKSQLGDDIYIKSASIDSNGIADIVESLSVHPFEQVKAVTVFDQPTIID